MEAEITFQLGSHHIYRQPSPLIGGGRKPGHPA